ncbi:MAG: alpha/beta hydrolase [Myxococcota bacterium]
MNRPVSLVSSAALVCFLAACIALVKLERSGPAHTDVWLEGGVPATLFLPGERRGRQAFFDPPPEAERPAAVVLMHGFAGDRRMLSGLARRFAEGGVAVLTIDAAGHGENRNPYRRSLAQGGAFVADVGAAVDFLRMSPLVDGLRVAVGGHSMGAAAALDYATRDSAVAAAVMISGGRRLDGPFPPANALFLYAAGDPARTRDRADVLAARVAGVARLAPGRSHGAPERGDAVRVVEVAGAGHLSILWSEEAVRETLDWLRAAFGTPPHAGATPGDPRAPLFGLLALSFLLVLPGLGLLAARLAPARREVSGAGRFRDLAWLGAALVLAMLLVANAPRLVPVPLVVGDTLASLFAVAGLALLVALQLRRADLLVGVFERPWATLWAAAVTLAALACLLQPFAGALHGLALTPERQLAWLGTTLAFLPLALAFNLLFRRGSAGGASLAALCGRAVTFLVLALGVWLGVLAPALGLLLPALAGLALILELPAFFLHASSRNVLAITLVEAGWLALVTAAIMPTRG